MLGVLVVCLPTQFTDGNSSLWTESTVWSVFHTGCSNAKITLSYIFCDVEHEIPPITDEYHIILTYYPYNDGLLHDTSISLDVMILCRNKGSQPSTLLIKCTMYICFRRETKHSTILHKVWSSNACSQVTLKWMGQKTLVGCSFPVSQILCSSILYPLGFPKGTSLATYQTAAILVSIPAWSEWCSTIIKLLIKDTRKRKAENEWMDNDINRLS